MLLYQRVLYIYMLLYQLLYQRVTDERYRSIYIYVHTSLNPEP